MLCNSKPNVGTKIKLLSIEKKKYTSTNQENIGTLVCSSKGTHINTGTSHEPNIMSIF